MPVLFVGHGSPMNAIEDNQFSRTWRLLGEALPQTQGDPVHQRPLGDLGDGGHSYGIPAHHP